MNTKVKQEIKAILREDQLWMHEDKLDLTVERLAVLMDREAIKKQLADHSFDELRTHANPKNNE